MIYYLKVEQYDTVNKVYRPKWTCVLSQNDIIYPDLNGAANRFLASLNLPWEIFNGVTFPDGWSYFKARLVPVVTPPTVTLPENDAAAPTPEPLPGDYEIRCIVTREL